MPNLHPKYYGSHLLRVFNGLTPKTIPETPRVTVEMFMDYNCIFSGRLFTKVNREVVPLLQQKKLADKFEFSFIHVVQPWHHINSGAEHEVALAVSKVYPGQFWKYSQVIFDNGSQFYDTEMYNVTRKEAYGKLIKLAVDNLDSVSAEKLWEQVAVPPTADGKPGQTGNNVAADLKYFTRYERTLGVHVTPTVFVNGIVSPKIESSSEPSKIVEVLEGQL